MATLLYTIIGITAGASLNCGVRREISPCTCSPHELYPSSIEVKCEQMDSFGQVVNSLQNRFQPDFNIRLSISHSKLADLDQRTFAEMNMNIKTLKMVFDDLSYLPVNTFQNLPRLEYFSATDNAFEEIPSELFLHMPNVGTLDFARGKIKQITSETFKNCQNLRHLLLAKNYISRLDRDSIPKTVHSLHFGFNNLSSLNGTLKNLREMKLLFINENNLTNLDGELPEGSPILTFILAQKNKITHLPKSIATLKNLDSLVISANRLRSFDGLLAGSNNLLRLEAEFNEIYELQKDEFLECERLEEIFMSGNFLTTLNGSLVNCKSLLVANFSHNLLKEFSLNEVKGLKKLRVLDLSSNRIEKLTGRMENLVDSGSLIYELRLEYNLLKTLDGALMGLNNLRILNIAHNLLETITPDDLIGMEELESLDLSFNKLETLEELSKTYLPSLDTLNASYNLLTNMNKDFHGLPILCTADLSNNMIRSLSTDLVSNTRCSNHGVPNKLDIYLQENPVLCDASLQQLVTQMESFHTRLIGVAHCIVPQQLSIDSPMFMQPPIPLLPNIIKSQMPMSPSPVMMQPPSIVQILVPMNPMSSGQQMSNHPQIQTLESQLIPQQKLDDLKYDAQPEVVETETFAPQEENEVKKVTVPSTTTMQTILEFKNIIHGVYSPSPPEIFPLPIEKSQGLSPELEDPPEVIQADQNVEISE